MKIKFIKNTLDFNRRKRIKTLSDKKTDEKLLSIYVKKKNLT